MSDFNEWDFTPADRWDDQDSDPIEDIYQALLTIEGGSSYERKKHWGMKILRYRNQKAEERK